MPARPALSYQTFDTTLPEQIDAAVEFVMSRLARSIGVRDEGAQVSVQYEIFQSAASEAILNAIAQFFMRQRFTAAEPLAP